MDFTATYCPYCNSSQYNYRYVEVYQSLNSINKITAIEIYCSQCRVTLSITPLIPSFS